MKKEIESEETIREYYTMQFNFKDGTSCFNAGIK